ncbi:hypothetical protein RvY_10988 [Ramazzottius varieornatus]|uniref:Uncharacterized protein n=1 Tax=Ramazzottius varieornatus TaxID=947166 RepID=A0A1D1VEM2_RAMVA|nr:hypothetical protein RvY_10988 [Ramazzottius varieornatus]
MIRCASSADDCEKFWKPRCGQFHAAMPLRNSRCDKQLAPRSRIRAFAWHVSSNALLNKDLYRRIKWIKLLILCCSRKA